MLSDTSYCIYICMAARKILQSLCGTSNLPKYLLDIAQKIDEVADPALKMIDFGVKRAQVSNVGNAKEGKPLVESMEYLKSTDTFSNTKVNTIAKELKLMETMLGYKPKLEDSELRNENVHLVMNRNNRKPKSANHGKRPVV